MEKSVKVLRHSKVCPSVYYSCQALTFYANKELIWIYLLGANRNYYIENGEGFGLNSEAVSNRKGYLYSTGSLEPTRKVDSLCLCVKRRMQVLRMALWKGASILWLLYMIIAYDYYFIMRYYMLYNNTYTLYNNTYGDLQ